MMAAPFNTLRSGYFLGGKVFAGAVKVNVIGSLLQVATAYHFGAPELRASLRERVPESTAWIVVIGAFLVLRKCICLDECVRGAFLLSLV